MLTNIKIIRDVVVFVAMASLVMAIFYFRAQASVAEGRAAVSAKELSDTRAQLDQAKKINDDEQKTIAQITSLREADDKLITGFETKLDSIRQADIDTQSKIDQLGAGNADVQTYYDAPVPDIVGGLLGGKRSKPGSSNDLSRQNRAGTPAVHLGSTVPTAGRTINLNQSPAR